MSSKVRTQIQLERRQYEILKRLAFEQRRSLSDVLRTMVDAALTGELAGTRKPDTDTAKLAFVGSGSDRDGKRDVARRHNHYIYGSE